MSTGSNNTGATSPHAAVEYQAVILATAIGAALFPLTSDGESGTNNSTDEQAGGGVVGRSILPLANRPLLWYQLDMIHAAGFPQVIVVTRDSMRRNVQRVCDEWRAARSGGANGNNGGNASGATLNVPSAESFTSPSHARSDRAHALLEVELVALERYAGSADALRRIAPRLRTDFFVLGGDLVTNLPFQNLADVARAHDAGLVMAVQAEETPSASVTSEVDAKEKKKAEAEAAAAGVDAQFFGVDAGPSSGSFSSASSSGAGAHRLLLFQTQADVGEEPLRVSKRLLAAYPRFELHTRWKSAHLYLFSYWVLLFLASKPSLCSIQSDLIPCLVSGQFKAKYAEWRAYGKNTQQALALRMSHAVQQGCFAGTDGQAAVGAPLTPPNLARGISEMPSSASMTDLAGQQSPITPKDAFQEAFRLFVYPVSNGLFCARAHTLAAYKSLNHELAADRQYAYMPWPATATDNAAERIQKAYEKAVVLGRETVVGEGTVFQGEGGYSTVKRSCIGAGCTIGARVKLQGCVVMDGVTIGEGCALTDCLVSAGARIGAGSTLKDCKIGPKFSVPAGTEGKNEILCQEDDEEEDEQ